jgi:tripartite-type tricarboxylate transporter receptor subunit TctC
MIAGFAPGGSIDLRCRLFARHLPKHIPGNPTIIVQNMTGAGGLIAANHTFGVAKRDGLSMLHFPSSTIMNNFFAPAKVKYDIREIPILWAEDDSWLTVIDPKATGVKTAGNILKSRVKLAAGGSGVTSLRTLRPRLALQLYGVEHSWVTGYRGTGGLLAAFERGEINLFEVPMASYKTNIQPQEQEGKMVILWQTGIIGEDGAFKRSKLMPDLPTFAELLPEEKKKGQAWEGWQAAVVPQGFQSSLGLAPGVPAERLKILSEALRKMEEDPAYRKDYEQILGLSAGALVGDDATRIVKAGLKQLFDDYKGGVDYLRDLSKKKK